MPTSRANGQDNVSVKYYYTSSVAPVSVYTASPDVNGGIAQSLSFSTEPTAEAST